MTDLANFTANDLINELGRRRIVCFTVSADTIASELAGMGKGDADSQRECAEWVMENYFKHVRRVIEENGDEAVYYLAENCWEDFTREVGQAA